MSFTWADTAQQPLPRVIVLDAANHIVDTPDYSGYLA